MQISSINVITIPRQAEEQIQLASSYQTTQRQVQHRDISKKNRIILGLIIMVILGTYFALASVTSENQEKKQAVLLKQDLKEVEINELEEELDKVDHGESTLNDLQSQNIKPQEHLLSTEVQAREPSFKNQSLNHKPFLYKKLVTPQSSFFINKNLGFYIRKRRTFFKQKSLSLRKGNQIKLSNNLQLFNLTFSQYERALRLIQQSPFLQFRQQKVITLVEQQEKYYENHFNITKYRQLPMCVVVPSFRNSKRYRYYFNLYTILQQEYSNYHVVIIDDASDDRTADLIQHELQTNYLARQKVILMRNAHREYHMSNINKAVRQHCQKGQLLLVVDGDDELIGKFVFKLINAAYHRMKSLAIYTNHIQSKRQVLLDIGISRPYSQQTKQNNSYRFERHYYSHLRTVWVDLFLLIKETDFKDSQGKWFTNAVDNAIYYPIFQMACGEVEYLSQITYKYNTYTGNNVDNMEQEFRRSTSQQIRNKPTYSCLKQHNLTAYNLIKSYMDPK